MNTLVIVATALALAAVIPTAIWGISAIRDQFDGTAVRRRARSNPEQTLVDLLRARGCTRRLAERTIDGLKEEPAFSAANPLNLTKAEMLLVAEKMRGDFQSGQMSPALAKLYAEAVFETAKPSEKEI